MTSPFNTLERLRATYPTPMSNDQLGELLNAVAWAHRADGFGLFRKPNGGHCPQPQTGTFVSRDILMLPDGRMFDCLIDAEGKATPTWGEKDPRDPQLWVPPLDASVVLPPIPDVRPPAGRPLKPYNDAYAVEFGQTVNALYKDSGRSVDPGMIAVQAMRTWHDYQGGMSWSAARDKHVAEFKVATGL